MHKKANTLSPLQIKSMIIFVILAFSSTNLLAEEPRLLFKTSFDGISIDRSVISNQKIVGLDSTTGYTFPDDLPGNNSVNYFNYVIDDYQNYLDYVDTRVETVTGYDGKPTKALYIDYHKQSSHPGMTRNQYNMRGDSSGDASQRLDRMYIKYRIKAHIVGDRDWWMPIEWKQNGEHYRFSFYAYDADTEKPYWYLKGQVGTDGTSIDWHATNKTIPVPRDEWYTLECFWVGDSDPNKGRVMIAVNGQIVFDVHNRTKKPGYDDEMYYFSPFKIYGSKGHSWITDVVMMEEPPSTSILSPKYDPTPTPVPEETQGSFVIMPGVLQ